MIGKVLGNRYEIVEKIGTGGMSVVYKAKCRLLNRFVAVKILRDEFLDNEEFIKRFKIESQAAASLSHPNVVSVYDVGEQDNTHYIVMEYVDGITLKEYINQKKVLDWKEAVKIATQIGSALEHAHKNGIIHRDIKPHNIILTETGVAKVTDFGIARAATYFTVAFAGNAIGSVHYFSPEQARGGYTDHKTDIYSLGVVLYEMLTGTVPFEGDSPVSIAYKHIQENAIAPKDVNIEVPKAINDIVMKAMAKELDKRYPSAAAMIADLNASIDHPDDDIAVIHQNEEVDSPTLVIPAVNAQKNKAAKEIEVSSVKKSEELKKTATKEKTTKILAIVTALLVVGIMSVFGYRYMFGYSHVGSEDVVPNLIGKNENEALELLSKNNLTMVIKDRRNSDNSEAGIVLEQSPVGGMTVKIPNTVTVVLSTGKKDIIVPNEVNKNYVIAQNDIESLKLVAKITYEPSDTMPTGFVTRTSPIGGSTVKQGSEVEIFVSNGPSLVIPMPSLIGKSQEQAKKVLQDHNLILGDVTYVDNSSAYGTVVGQGIAPDASVSVGTKINLSLSTGKGVTPSQPTKKTKTLTISLPQDKPSTTVKVVSINSKGTQTTVYNKSHTKGESPITVSISGEGKEHIQVYFNGILSMEDDINFGEAR